MVISISILTSDWSRASKHSFDWSIAMGGGKGKKKFPEGAVRINYLQQCRHDIVTSVGGHHGQVLAAHMGQVMVR